MMTAAEKIIDSLKFSFEEADEQKNLFTPAHVLYKCRITTPARRRYTFDYQCNPSATHEPTIKDCLYCLLSDASSVDYCTDEVDFLNEFGYIDDAESSRRAYTVRRFSPDFLHVETVGEFQEHATKWGAREAAKEVVQSYERIYVCFPDFKIDHF